MEKKTRPFGVLDQVGYVCGDMADSFVNLFVDAYLLTFCTYVLGISPAWMATLFLVARLWDAINDPIMGSFPDRWRLGKSGDKFKPWIKLFMIPLALSGILCFSKVSFTGVALHAWVAFVYILYGMSYTGTSMPFGAMASVVSTDPIDRSKLSRARSIGGTLVGIGALSMVPVFCFDKASNIMPERFTLMAAIFGVLSIICYLLLCRFTPERVHEKHAPGQKFEYSKVLKAAFKNRPLIGVMIATIGSMLFITGSSQLRSYIYKEFYHDTGAMTIASLGSLPVMIICFILVPKIVAKFGKRNVILVMSASINTKRRRSGGQSGSTVQAEPGASFHGCRQFPGGGQGYGKSAGPQGGRTVSAHPAYPGGRCKAGLCDHHDRGRAAVTDTL